MLMLSLTVANSFSTCSLQARPKEQCNPPKHPKGRAPERQRKRLVLVSSLFYRLSFYLELRKKPDFGDARLLTNALGRKGFEELLFAHFLLSGQMPHAVCVAYIWEYAQKQNRTPRQSSSLLGGRLWWEKAARDFHYGWALPAQAQVQLCMSTLKQWNNNLFLSFFFFSRIVSSVLSAARDKCEKMEESLSTIIHL